MTNRIGRKESPPRINLPDGRYGRNVAWYELELSEPQIRCHFLNLIHVLEDVFALDNDLHAEILAHRLELVLHGVEVGLPYRA